MGLREGASGATGRVLSAKCLALCLAMTKGQGMALTVISAGAAYAAILLALTIWSVGGSRQFKARYLRVWDRGPRSVSGEEAR
jgi:hypothetical protein